MVNTTSKQHIHCLLAGEVLAEMAAKALASAMPTAQLRHAYRRQATDEARHADMFRNYLHSLGITPIEAAEMREVTAYRSFLVDAIERGRLLTLVLGVNVALEGLASVGLALSAQWVEGRGDDPAWVSLTRSIEQDERRHTRLAMPALCSLGAGVIPAEAREVMGEVREAAVATLGGVGNALAAWGIDPIAIFDASIRQAQPMLADMLLEPRPILS